MSIEVEIKLRISDKECIEKTLAEIGFCKGKFVMESDTYYMAEHHDFVGLDEALRVRCVENRGTGERSAVITYKGAKLDNTSMTRQELETSVGMGRFVGRYWRGLVSGRFRWWRSFGSIITGIISLPAWMLSRTWEIIWNWRLLSMKRRNGKQPSISWNRLCIRLVIPCRIRRELLTCLCF